MIETVCGQLYTGISTDIERRFEEHRAVFAGEGSKGAKYFRGREPRSVVYREAFEDRASASRREAAIKAMARPQKLKLYQSASNSTS